MANIYIYERSLKFHIIAVLLCIVLGVLSASFYMKYKFPISLNTPSYISQHFLRMLRETGVEELVGSGLFSFPEPKYVNSMRMTLKRSESSNVVENLIWNKAISGSVPLLFRWKKGTSPIVEMTHNHALSTTCSKWQPLDPSNEQEKNLIQEHEFFKSMLVPIKPVETTIICPTSKDADSTGISSDSKINLETNTFMNLKQNSYEEYLCFIGNPDKSQHLSTQSKTYIQEDKTQEDKIHIIAIDPFHSDFMIHHEDKSILNSDFVKLLYESHFTSDWNNHPLIIKNLKEKQKKLKMKKHANTDTHKQKITKRSIFDRLFKKSFPIPNPQLLLNEENDQLQTVDTDPIHSKLPSSVHGALHKGECVFLPSYWWYYMEVENRSGEIIQLTRSQYKPHSALVELFAETWRENLKK